MANTPSALKRVRQTAKRTARNRTAKSRLKTARNAVLAALKTGDKQAAVATLQTATSVLGKVAKVGIIHKNKARRLQSRLAKKVAAALKA